MEIIFNVTVLHAYPAGEFIGNAHEGSFMKFVVPEQKRKGNDLQHQEEEKIKIPSDEEKNVSHSG
jgi:hypothetical protein